MDSINRNQPEQNHQDLQGQAAIKKIRELADEAGSCFFCTASDGLNLEARPMSVQEVDEAGNLWFLSADDSHKNAEVARDPMVKLFFQGSAHSDFMELTGVASVCHDREKIEEYWSPVIKTWFTEGKDDPRISVIKVTPLDGYYWDTKHGHAVAGIKMLIGAATGKTLDDSIEGKLGV
jgi:general stress protein 26